MAKLSIYTNIYTNKLIRWAKKNKYKIKIHSKGFNNGKTYFVEVENNEISKQSLAMLLEEIILYKNPITKGCKPLCDNIKKFVFLPYKDDMQKTLLQFLEENNKINLEGYVNFRMDKYAHLINLTLYATIKKSF